MWRSDALPDPEATGSPERRHEPTVSFDELYEAEFAFVCRSLLRFGVARASLDDAAQDVFLVVHRQLAGFREGSSVRAWLFGIARRISRNHRRRRDRKEGGSEGHLELDPTLADPRGNPETASENAHAWRLVAACLAQLDEQKREVFMLSELEGLTAPEIAEAVGCPVNTVYSRLRAARALVEQQLAPRTTP